MVVLSYSGFVPGFSAAIMLSTLYPLIAGMLLAALGSAYYFRISCA